MQSQLIFQTFNLIPIYLFLHNYYYNYYDDIIYKNITGILGQGYTEIITRSTRQTEHYFFSLIIFQLFLHFVIARKPTDRLNL